MKLQSWNKSSSVLAISALQQEKSKIIKEFNEKFKTNLLQSFQDFFESFPEIKAIQWVQYTPYFNDGDACYFGTRDMVLEVFKDKRHNLFPSDEIWNKAENYFGLYEGHEAWFDKNNLRAKEILEALQILNQIRDADFYKSAWGDHCHIKVTREGLTQKEYDHE